MVGATRVNRSINWVTDDNGDVVGYDRRPGDRVLMPRMSDDGTALVSGDGDVLVLPDVVTTRADTLFTPEKVSMTASGSPCAAPSLLHRIRCIAGSAIALVVYDNPFGTSGTELYSGTLSAGDEAVIASPVRAINGPRGVFTGTATFEYHVSQGV